MDISPGGSVLPPMHRPEVADGVDARCAESSGATLLTLTLTPTPTLTLTLTLTPTLTLSQCFKMGIPLNTRHREVAPNQLTSYF